MRAEAASRARDAASPRSVQEGAARRAAGRPARAREQRAGRHRRAREPVRACSATRRAREEARYRRRCRHAASSEARREAAGASRRAVAGVTHAALKTRQAICVGGASPDARFRRRHDVLYARAEVLPAPRGAAGGDIRRRRLARRDAVAHAVPARRRVRLERVLTRPQARAEIGSGRARAARHPACLARHARGRDAGLHLHPASRRARLLCDGGERDAPPINARAKAVAAPDFVMATPSF